MNKPLRILHLEDDPDFAELVRSLLQKEGVSAETVLVSNRSDFEAALELEQLDVILADYLLPNYNGMDALRIAREKCPDVPFLLVSGTLGEQAAIESVKAGATDYVLKLWPERLVPAICRAVDETRERERRKSVETELVRREKYYRTLTENALDLVILLSRDGTILYNSPSLTRILGYDLQANLGRSAFNLVHPEDLPEMLQAFEAVAGIPEQMAQVEFRVRHADGSWRFMEAMAQNRLHDLEIGGVVVNSRDVTDRKRLEDQLRQAQKMEAIGQLAGGVAHDFNNILTVISGHASLLLCRQTLDEAAVRSAQQIGQAAERAAGLTRQLLTFSRRQVMQPRRLDLNEVVSNVTKMLSRILGEDVSLHLSYSSAPLLIQADAGMLEQVLLNFAVNSRDAMPGGGVLSVKISEEEIRGARVNGSCEAREGRFACLTVSDTGSGIPAETLPRIFEPFFTTKEVGKGTGLGLATVYGVVKQHQGWVEVESEVGKGTVFRVFLPVCPSANEPSAEPNDLPAVRGGSETILVVEDEAPVRELVSSFLSGYGYTVLQAETGRKALELWKDRPQSVDLLLTDLVMPDRMNGRELAERLSAERPGLKVIYTSGYSADVVGRDFVLRGGLNYLQKPYHPQKLALAVRECLDTGS
jgi:PAS domain S-box-containing protein